MTDTLPKTNKLKATYIDWRNRPYAAGNDKKKQQAEAFEALNSFVRRHGGAVTSPPGKVLRIEVPKGSALADELQKLGYIVAERGTVTRITGTDTINPAGERFVGVQTPFAEVDVLEIRLDGR